MLPLLARKEVERLTSELQDAHFQLESVPTTTIEFVKSLTFLEEIQIRVTREFEYFHPLISAWFLLKQIMERVHFNNF